MNALIQTLLRAQTYGFRGRLGADPEVRYLNSSSSVCNVRIGVDLPDKKGRDDQRPSDWIKLEIWGDEAQTFADNTRKGQLIDVVGRVKSESWTDKNTGEQVYGLVMRVHTWAPVDTGASKATTAKPAPAPAATPGGSVWESSGGDDISEEEVPF